MALANNGIVNGRKATVRMTRNTVGKGSLKGYEAEEFDI
jgi:hypothetical protein